MQLLKNNTISETEEPELDSMVEMTLQAVT